jgi:outer membrane protein assembly factor BamE (lipoprotein component of BamABCDE complex)
MRGARLIAAGALTLSLAGCAGTAFDWSSARQIKTGMTEQDVIAIMGDPYLVKSQNGAITWVWSYAEAFSGSKAVSVVFVDGKVSEPPPIPASFR